LWYTGDGIEKRNNRLGARQTAFFDIKRRILAGPATSRLGLALAHRFCNLLVQHGAYLLCAMTCPTCGNKAVVISPEGEYVCAQCGTVLGPVYVWPVRRVDERLAEKAAELSRGLRAVLVKRGIPLREWLELGGARERLRQGWRADWVPPSKRVEYYVEVAVARLGLGRAAVEEALALYRRLERRALTGKSPRVVAAAVIYAATCTPARAAAEALGVSPISVKDTVRKLKLAVKMCVRRGVGQRQVDVYA